MIGLVHWVDKWLCIQLKKRGLPLPSPFHRFNSMNMIFLCCILSSISYANIILECQLTGCSRLHYHNVCTFQLNNSSFSFILLYYPTIPNHKTIPVLPVNNKEPLVRACFILIVIICKVNKYLYVGCIF